MYQAFRKGNMESAGKNTQVTLCNFPLNEVMFIRLHCLFKLRLSTVFFIACFQEECNIHRLLFAL